jgi:two-component system nitrogen regulation response regulator GlnG
MLKVFFVDDDTSILNSFRRLLQYYRKQFDFSFFNNGNDALASDILPDVLITDAMMPGLSGMDLIRLLKKRFPGLVTVILSGEVGASFPDELGIDFFLEKPCDVEDIIDILEKYEA